jgi:hypothetical protein
MPPRPRGVQAYQEEHRAAVRAAARNAKLTALNDDDAPVATLANGGTAAAPVAAPISNGDAHGADGDAAAASRPRKRKKRDRGREGVREEEDDDEGALVERLEGARGRRRAVPAEEAEVEETEEERAERLEREKCAVLLRGRPGQHRSCSGDDT